MSDSALMAVAACAGLSICAALLAFVLRLAGVPGERSAAAIVAGISVGLLAGPGVFGRGWPVAFERLVLGGERESAAVAAMAERHREELLALAASGVTGAAVEEHREQQKAEMSPLAARRDEARAARRGAMTWASQGCFALYLVLIGGCVVPAARTARGRWRGWNQWFGSSVAIGFAAAAMSCVLPAALGAWLLGLSAREVVAFAVILGAPGIAATLPPRMFVASAVGLFACLSVAVLVGWSVGMTVVATGLCLGLMAGLGFDDPATAQRVRRWGGVLAHGVALPAAAALVAVYVDLHGLIGGAAWKFWWAVVIAMLWSSDGRWVAWMVAWRGLGGGGRAWATGAACVNSGAGVVQLGLTIVLSAAGLADGSIVAAGLLGAALVEVTRGMRGWMGAWMDAVAPV